MAVRDIFKVSRKTFVNPSAWLNFGILRDENKTLFTVLKDMTVPPKAARVETFEQAMQRLNLEQTDLKEAALNYFVFAIFFLILAGGSVLFGFYLLLSHHHTFSGWLLSMAVTALFLAQAFKYHFWHFQIKHKKLGCTLAEWRSGKPVKKGTAS